MKVNYNIQKEERKAMVGIISKAVGEKLVYCAAPSFSYKVGAFEITKDGSLCFDDGADEATVARVRTGGARGGLYVRGWGKRALLRGHSGRRAEPDGNRDKRDSLRGHGAE